MKRLILAGSATLGARLLERKTPISVENQLSGVDVHVFIFYNHSVIKTRVRCMKDE